MGEQSAAPQRGFEFDIGTANLAIARDDRSMGVVAQVNADYDEEL
jgi:hypothetical protein